MVHPQNGPCWFPRSQRFGLLLGRYFFSISSFSPKAIIRIIAEKPLRMPKTFLLHPIWLEESGFSEEERCFIGTDEKIFLT